MPRMSWQSEPWHEGVLVRDCQSFGLGKSYIRVAVRSHSENEQLIAALEKALACRD